MKTILLSSLFSLFISIAQACSCFYISDYFCPTASWFSSNSSGNTLYIAQVKVISIYGYYMDVQVLDNLHNTLPVNEATILGQDGLNCNEWLGPFEEGKTFILAIYESNWQEGLYDLNGCGRFWLPVVEDQVQGNISENTQQQSYEDFKQSLAQCAGINPTAEPGLAAVQIFPNPTSGEVYLKGLAAGAPLGYTLYSLTGAVVQAGEFNSGPSPSLSLAGLPKGLYLLRLQVDEAVLARRIVLGND
ncbi:MAG: T9SS type A sorting domain-containing protein [Phaeodactylibacter sp.]|nr:T9SS type A sorting domain-containing protein [Phaeodactylibacter sp.]